MVLMMNINRTAGWNFRLGPKFLIRPFFGSEWGHPRIGGWGFCRYLNIYIYIYVCISIFIYIYIDIYIYMYMYCISTEWQDFIHQKWEWDSKCCLDPRICLASYYKFHKLLTGIVGVPIWRHHHVKRSEKICSKHHVPDVYSLQLLDFLLTT